MGRHILAAFTMLLLIGVVVFGAVWGWQSLSSDLPDPSKIVVEEPTPSCTPKVVEAGRMLRARQVQVSVFNGGSRQGLAGETLDALIERGFIGGEIGNAPLDLNVVRVQVWARDVRDPRARLVAKQFGPNVEVWPRKRDLGDGVDVIVGNVFTELKPAPTAVRVRKALKLCVPAAVVD